MKLRSWQSECIHSAISKYKSHKHFLALATPGAGKTVMASVLAKLLYDKGDIDLVLSFSPSSIVAHDFSEALSEQFETHFDGTIGALGNSFTYQALGTLDNKVWRLFEKYRVFVIFDEIHHCAGSNMKDANAWGKPIISMIKQKAAYTIALTGTPWRSDALPIALADYCNESGQIQCDYVYGLKQAIADNVCRIPQVVALDNDQITVVEGDETSHFTSFIDLLSLSIIPYSEIVTNTSVIEQLLIHSSRKLNELRCINKEAGGLIVASSIAHAWQIQLILKQTIGENAVVVTSDESNGNGLIRSFRYNQQKWIISVGMISEGTNIPRLQVCCYLSNVKTEMNYRQVMGRILRITDAPNQQAILFIPAEPKLVEYAYRVAQDIPDELAKVKFAQMDEEIIAEAPVLNEGDDIYDTGSHTIISANKPTISIGDVIINADESLTPFNDMPPSEIAISTDKVMGIFGQLNHKELEIDGFEQLIISEQSMKKLDLYSAEAF
ncbi:DEAD/DEAH box helicase family protein [Pseudoalteromonas sp. MMG024]|uniref:DEAD/DEAH box helicase n=1 Tax=Pseudoalteromonas sp. MMG024 TaxID=2909980 RepID=UPI001F417F96|nr:DEAD/DEAH box helicase family protein [Pseudoalteromonas sp. MMG024]MCF6458986.1 DEAD/DEAH box helicase family protein [Pseudoalteromonas sp. MMG024]